MKITASEAIQLKNSYFFLLVCVKTDSNVYQILTFLFFNIVTTYLHCCMVLHLENSLLHSVPVQVCSISFGLNLPSVPFVSPHLLHHGPTPCDLTRLKIKIKNGAFKLG